MKRKGKAARGAVESVEAFAERLYVELRRSEMEPALREWQRAIAVASRREALTEAAEMLERRARGKFCAEAVAVRRLIETEPGA